jgi:hypothetical protein
MQFIENMFGPSKTNPHSSWGSSVLAMGLKRRSLKALVIAYSARPSSSGMASKFPMHPLSLGEPEPLRGELFQVTKSGYDAGSNTGLGEGSWWREAWRTEKQKYACSGCAASLFCLSRTLAEGPTAWASSSITRCGRERGKATGDSRNYRRHNLLFISSFLFFSSKHIMARPPRASTASKASASKQKPRKKSRGPKLPASLASQDDPARKGKGKQKASIVDLDETLDVYSFSSSSKGQRAIEQARAAIASSDAQRPKKRRTQDPEDDDDDNDELNPADIRMGRDSGDEEGDWEGSDEEIDSDEASTDGEGREEDESDQGSVDGVRVSFPLKIWTRYLNVPFAPSRSKARRVLLLASAGPVKRTMKPILTGMTRTALATWICPRCSADRVPPRVAQKAKRARTTIRKSKAARRRTMMTMTMTMTMTTTTTEKKTRTRRLD